MCLGGHLAFRCAFDPRIRAAVCYFATDIHSHTLGKNEQDDSLNRAKEIKGELLMVCSHTSETYGCLSNEAHVQIFGKRDTHVPPAGRDLIRKTLHEFGVTFSFFEPAWAQHAFIRDELSKGRYDPALSSICFSMLLELFHRTLSGDLGPHHGDRGDPEHVC